MTPENAALLRCGTAEPPPERRVLRAGDLSCVLEAGALRHIAWRGIEVLRGIAYLVRDTSWGTPQARIEDLVVEEEPRSFRAAFTAIVQVEGAAFRIEARIDAAAEGTLDFAATGAALAPLDTNRCGFVVLHPAEFGGLALAVRHTDGTATDTRFPAEISPSQPVSDIRALSCEPAPGLRTTCTLTAELPQDPAGRFEMEDQRNWSDASFKTYVGSLLDPWPHRMEPGRAWRQRVGLRIEDGLKPHATQAGVREPGLALGQAAPQRLPLFGTSIPQGAVALGPRASDRFALLRPRLLVVSLEQGRPGQAAQLRAAASLAGLTGAPVQLEAVLAATAPPEEELAHAALLCAEAGLRVDAVLACPRALLRSYQPSDTWPELPASSAIAIAARRHFPGARIGGGMVTYFTELNRRRPEPDGLDFISHATAPIVHAADDVSVMETLQALPHMARTVRALWPGLGHRMGPSSIAMRSNPYGSALAPNPDRIRMPLAGDDPRQAGLFAAAWTIGHAASLAREGIEALSLHASHGPSGVLATAGAPWAHLVGDAVVLPVFHALRALAAASGCRVLPVTGAPPGIAALAWTQGASSSMAIANLTQASARVALPGTWRAHRLDLPEFAAAVRDPLWLDRPAPATGSLELGAYASAFLVAA